MALVGHYKLNGNALDSSWNGRHGTVSGATATTDGLRSCYSFDGVDDYINLNYNLLDYPENFTLSIWIKNDTSGTEEGRIWQAGLTSGATNYGFAFLKFTSGADVICYFVIKPTSGTECYCATISIPNGEWVNVIVTKNANIINTYRNGIFLATKDIITSEYRRDIWTSIGGSQVNLNFKGLIDDVRIYDHILSLKEIKELSLGKFAHYKFDGNAKDCSNNELHGTAYNNISYNTLTPLIGSSSISFPGTFNEYVELPFGNGFNPSTNDLSISMWVLTNDIINNIVCITSGGYGTGSSFYVGIKNSKWDMSIQSNVWGGGSITAVEGKKTHIGITFNKTTLKASMYVDGVLTREWNYTSYTFANEIWLGALAGISYAWNGLIDDVQFFSTTLTQQDFINIMQTSASMTDKGDIIVNEVNEIGISSGLVGYYPLRKNANDYSGSGYNGTVSGAVVSTNRFSEIGSYSFDGSDDYINLNRNLLTYPENFTVSFWVYNDISGPESYVRIFDGGQSSSPQYGFAVVCTATDQSIDYAYIFLTTNNSLKQILFTVPDSTWTHITLIKNGTLIQIYINGVYFNQNTLAQSEYRRDISTYIGGRTTVSNFKGKIDDVRIYDRALTESEINTLYNYTKGKINANKQIQAKSFSECSITNGLVGWYPLRKNANDYSGYNRHGTVSGAVVSTNRFNESGSYSFDGVDDYIDLNRDLNDYPDDFTFSYWVYVDKSVGTDIYKRLWFGGTTGSANIYGFDNFLGNTSTSLILGFAIRTTDNAYQEKAVLLTDKTWTNILITKNGTNVKCYKNTEIFGEMTLSISEYNVRTRPVNTYLGGILTGNSFGGKIDDVRIYDRALTEKEIVLLYEYGKTKITNDGIIYTKEIKEII